MLGKLVEAGFQKNNLYNLVVFQFDYAQYQSVFLT